MSSSTKFLAAMLTSAALVTPMTAWAQAETQAAEDDGIRDIVVTARRVEERLQSIPVAVTALDSQAIAERQVVSVADLQRSAPGLNAQGGGPGVSSIIYLSIRGNSQIGAGSTSDPAVGVYVDGVFYARPIVSNLGLLDMAGAEVLRGTQGTLFGRNTTGGALNLTTVVPDGTTSGYLKAGYGNYNAITAEGAVQVPIGVDGGGFRLAGRYTKHDGYGNNPITGYDVGKLNSDVSVRATLAATPDSSPLQIVVSADYTRSRDQGVMTALGALNPASLAALYSAPIPGYNYNLAQYVQNNSNFYQSFGSSLIGPGTYRPGVLAEMNKPFNKNEAWGIRGTVTYDLGDVQFKAITAWRQSTSSNAQDLDSTPAPILQFASKYHQHQFSEEMQLSGETGNLQWILGGIYFREAGDERSHSATLNNIFAPQGFLLPPGASPFFPNGIPATNTIGNFAASGRNFGQFVSTSTGLFAQANYSITDRLRVTGGFRYTWDKRKLNRHIFNNIQTTPEFIIPPPFVVQPLTCLSGPNAGTVNNPAICNDPFASKYNYPAWLASVDYKLSDDVMVYAKTGGAALSGGFNTRQVPAGTEAFAPEKVKDAEIGMKGDFLDNHLRLNLAGFYVWRNGAQNNVSIVVNNRTTQFTTNQGDIRSYGLEGETTIIPWDGMELTGAVSYLHSKYKSGSFFDQGVAGPVDRSGEVVPRAPKWNFNAGFTQKVPLGNGELSIHADYSYTSKISFAAGTADLTNPALTQAQKDALVAAMAVANKVATAPGFSLVNARIGYKMDEPGIELALWVRNALKEKYLVNVTSFYGALGTATNYQGNPRTFGITAQYNF